MKFQVLSLLVAGGLAACSKSEAPPVSPPVAQPVAAASAPADAPGIAWREASNDAEVDAAFALARTSDKPVFMYWGASWCPPCNQLKATLFNRQEFIERTRAYVAVAVDGDRSGAQKVGARFQVRGYPTMVLFDPQGQELARLPGEVDAAQVSALLAQGQDIRKPFKAVFEAARAGGAGLAPGDWSRLAFHSWETDQALVGEQKLAALLDGLARACPADAADAGERLALKALANTDTKDAKPSDASATRVLHVLADASRSRALMDVLTNAAAEIVTAATAPKTPTRATLAAAFDTRLVALQADATLSRADRFTALAGRIAIAQLDGGKTPPALADAARSMAAQADREITDGYERQAVITTAADVLERAGLIAESDALLKANLARSHSPYYLMTGLALNAKKRGDKAEALRWYQQAFDTSEGPATRLQWGAALLAALVELAPADAPRIERTAAQLFDEASKQGDAFHDRSGRSLQRIGTALAGWSAKGAHGAEMTRLRTKLGAQCDALPEAEPAQRESCRRVLTAPSAKRTS